MNRVRLGRALGYGTRHAAKTFAAAVEAAVADPERPLRGPHHSREGAPAPSPPGAGRSKAPRGVSVGVRNIKQSFWQPLVVFSGALWLRVTGLFFALLAVTMGGGAWRMRAALRGVPGAGVHRFWVFAVFACLFGYFAVSSFVRATLKERRAAAR